MNRAPFWPGIAAWVFLSLAGVGLVLAPEAGVRAALVIASLMVTVMLVWAIVQDTDTPGGRRGRR